MQAFQDYYPEVLAHCYGCGRNNEHGHQIKTFWDGDETVTHFQPRPEHTAIPGFVHGGLLASLIDNNRGQPTIVIAKAPRDLRMPRGEPGFLSGGLNAQWRAVAARSAASTTRTSLAG